MKNKLVKALALGLSLVMASGTAVVSVAAEEAAPPLVVGYDTFSQKFSPFFATSSYDMDISAIVCPSIFGLDRAGEIVYHGIEGETREYNGTEYTYYSLADIDVEKGEDETVYTITMRDDATFSDGEPITADDLIFTFYALLDNDYDGSVTLASTPIKGLANYMANSSVADSITDEDIAAALEEMPEELEQLLSETVITPLLLSEADWCVDVFEDYKDYFGAETPEDMFAILYAQPLQEDYDASGKDMDTIVAETAALYGGDYVTLATNYGDPAYLDEGAITATRQFVADDKKANGEGEDVPNVAGIVKTGDHQVQVTTDGFNTSTIYQLGVQLAPLHYYGDRDLYDYENNSFGFTRGDLSLLREKTSVPMGWGPYKFDSYDNRIVYMSANESYYLGAPKIASIQFKETSESDKIPGVQQGTTDLSQPTGSKSNFDQIKQINGNDELSGDVLTTVRTDFLGYGYIGINADLVKVGEDASSDASKALRKAIATIVASVRDVNIDTYYGDAAAVINYPISSVSWASPQKSYATYEIAFSRDAAGDAVYTEGMSAEEKNSAAQQAALSFFEAAGYTVADGKITEAPSEGGPLQIEVLIPGGGDGNHPSYGILTDAKNALEEIGFTLEINDLSDSNVLWDSLDANTCEMWCAAWGATADPDMYQVYHSDNVTGSGTGSNHYMIADSELDSLIMEARTSEDQEFRKDVYKQCLDIILDWAVEIPVYQRQECTLVSTERVNIDTLVQDMSPYYGWYAELENLEMN